MVLFAVVIKGRGEFLAISRRRDRWIPQRHIEPGETAQVTARGKSVRKLTEEN